MAKNTDLNIGWVDFSKSDRNMVMNVLRQIAEQGALDELGIGSIRDAFSDIFFPGTSSTHTRAKYFFLVPYICMDLERDKKLQSSEFIAKLEEKEIKLITPLAKDGEWGVIGLRAGEDLTTKPSSRYWPALRKYGFITDNQTLQEYADSAYEKQHEANLRESGGQKRKRDKWGDEENTGDDTDVGLTGKRRTSFWPKDIPYRKNWRDKLSLKLTKLEAVFFRERIINSADPEIKNSLLALVLRTNRRKNFPRDDSGVLKAFGVPKALERIMPPDMKNDYHLARNFSRFVFGAQVRYNVIYSEGQNKDANNEWKKYINDPPEVDLDAIRSRLKLERERKLEHEGKKMNDKNSESKSITAAIAFLKDFQKLLEGKTINLAALDKLICAREGILKQERAKLNKDKWDDKSVINMERLTYRLPNAQNLVNDIFEGEDNDHA